MHTDTKKNSSFLPISASLTPMPLYRIIYSDISDYIMMDCCLMYTNDVQLILHINKHKH